MSAINEGVKQFRQQRAEQRATQRKPLTEAEQNRERRKAKLLQRMTVRQNKAAIVSGLKTLFEEQQAKEKPKGSLKIKVKTAKEVEEEKQQQIVNSLSGRIIGLSMGHLRN